MKQLSSLNSDKKFKIKIKKFKNRRVPLNRKCKDEISSTPLGSSLSRKKKLKEDKAWRC
jgi:hypothetical protein